MCDFHTWYLNIFRKFILMWLLSVIILELVMCSPHDVHRFVFRTHQWKNRDRDNYYKYHPSHRQIRKPVAPPNNDEWPSETIKTDHQYYNYRPNHENESYNSNRRGKSRNYTTVKPLALFDIPNVEFTTKISEKLQIPIIKNAFLNYYHPLNNSLDLHGSIESKQNINFSGNTKEVQGREASKNTSKGYEVYEEVIEDVSPPPSHNLLLSIVRNLPAVTTTMPTVILKDEENHIKENISESSTENNKTYGKRTKSRRNRGNVKFE